MAGRLGIGIITYNRAETVQGTVEAVRRMTSRSDADLVVADDGSTDNTLEVLSAMNVAVISGDNTGIAWNKNRALFVLSRLLDCETIILLEDDVRPSFFGWEVPWVAAAKLWGHANWAAPWMKDFFLSGSGTPDDPFMSHHVSAQCACFSRDSLIYGGYFDTRFRGFGHEHVEHSRRLLRVGYGGTDRMVDGKEEVLYRLIESPLTVIRAGSFQNDEEVERNVKIAHRAMAETVTRGPWANEAEMRQMRTEVERMNARLKDGFVLNRPTVQAPPPARQASFGQRLRRWVGLN